MVRLIGLIIAKYKLESKVWKCIGPMILWPKTSEYLSKTMKIYFKE
jgi:hypothetical protein